MSDRCIDGSLYISRPISVKGSDPVASARLKSEMRFGSFDKEANILNSTWSRSDVMITWSSSFGINAVRTVSSPFGKVCSAGFCMDMRLVRAPSVFTEG